MKTATLLIAFIAMFPAFTHAIVDPARMRQDIENRIAEIQDSRAQIKDAQVSVSLTKEERSQLEEWGKSLDEEKRVLSERLKLFWELQETGVITYIAPEVKTEKQHPPKK